MTDIVDRQTRSRMMSGIRGTNTKPELLLRKALHSRGLRYRLHHKKLPGTPDLVFAKHNAVLFVHGCFWHRHRGCKYATSPKTRPEFWSNKFEQNIERDRVAQESLKELGWRIATVWECALKSSPTSQIAGSVHDWLEGTEEAFIVDGRD